jgi:hypothetical protein
LEGALFKLSPPPAFPGQPISLLGQHMLLPEAFALCRAFSFDFSNMGNCAHRSSYAALKFCEFFKDAEVKVFIRNEKSRDQYFVVFENKEKEIFVYDPLTNPELVFTEAEYRKKILPLFPLTTNCKVEMNILVTQELREKYRKIADEIRDRFRKDTSFFDEQILKSDMNIIFSMHKNKIPMHLHHEMIEKACRELKSKCSQKQLAVSQQGEEKAQKETSTAKKMSSTKPQEHKTQSPSLASDSPVLSPRTNIIKSLTPFRTNTKTTAFFKAFDANNYNQALRTACTSTLQDALLIVEILLKAHIVNPKLLNLNPNETAGEFKRNAFHLAASKGGQAMYDLLSKYVVDQQVEDHDKKPPKAYLASSLNLQV